MPYKLNDAMLAVFVLIVVINTLLHSAVFGGEIPASEVTRLALFAAAIGYLVWLRVAEWRSANRLDAQARELLATVEQNADHYIDTAVEFAGALSGEKLAELRALYRKSGYWSLAVGIGGLVIIGQMFYFGLTGMTHDHAAPWDTVCEFPLAIPCLWFWISYQARLHHLSAALAAYHVVAAHHIPGQRSVRA